MPHKYASHGGLHAECAVVSRSGRGRPRVNVTLEPAEGDGGLPNVAARYVRGDPWSSSRVRG
jgi:hypothetical protein